MFASRTRDRAFSEHRHGGHFGAPIHGSRSREGIYTKPVYDALNAPNRRSKTVVEVGRPYARVTRRSSCPDGRRAGWQTAHGYASARQSADSFVRHLRI